MNFNTIFEKSSFLDIWQGPKYACSVYIIFWKIGKWS